MVEYRLVDYDRDLEKIVGLIRQNLNPSYTTEFLRWKHYHNPFGKSIGMVATTKGKIVGVVFYMRYNFKNDKAEIIRGLRPVDGCTDADQRGKGIFKKLMTACLNQHNSNFEFIMATPNSNSYPELIKLGWKKPKNVYTYRWGGVLKSKLMDGEFQDIPTTIGDHMKPLSAGGVFQVGNSLEFLLWRYHDPVYKKLKFESGGSVIFIVYRIGRIKGIRTLILCDSYGYEMLLPTALKKILTTEKIHLIFYLENKFNTHISPLFSFKHKTARILFKGENYDVLDNLVISLGDLEGKI